MSLAALKCGARETAAVITKISVAWAVLSKMYP